MAEVIGGVREEGENRGLVMEKLGAGRWRINGTMRIEDFRREFPQLGEVKFAETLGGLLSDQLGVIPAAGESVVFRGLRLTAQVVDERRVKELLVETVNKRHAK